MPEKENFYEDECAKVYYDETLDSLFLEYLSKVKTYDQFITINTAALEAFKKKDTQKFVADIRKMGVISVDSQQWIINTMIPEMIKHLNGRTLFHAQFLDPSEIFSKVSGSNIKNKTSSTNSPDGLVVEQFSDWGELEKFLHAH